MQDEGRRKMSGEVEVDETYIGGKARNRHASGAKREDQAVMLLERQGCVCTKVIRIKRRLRS